MPVGTAEEAITYNRNSDQVVVAPQLPLHPTPHEPAGQGEDEGDAGEGPYDGQFGDAAVLSQVVLPFSRIPTESCEVHGARKELRETMLSTFSRTVWYKLYVSCED